MKFYVLIFLLTSMSVFAQTKLEWSDLKCDWNEEWSKEFQAVYMVPAFNESQKQLSGQEIVLEGSIVNLSVEEDGEDYFALGENSWSFGCFISNGGDQSCEIVFKEGIVVDVEMNDVVKVKGVLRLNSDDILRLAYILEDAEIVE